MTTVGTHIRKDPVRIRVAIPAADPPDNARRTSIFANYSRVIRATHRRFPKHEQHPSFALSG